MVVSSELMADGLLDDAEIGAPLQTVGLWNHLTRGGGQRLSNLDRENLPFVAWNDLRTEARRSFRLGINDWPSQKNSSAAIRSACCC